MNIWRGSSGSTGRTCLDHSLRCCPCSWHWLILSVRSVMLIRPFDVWICTASRQASKRSTPNMCLCMHAGLYNMVSNCRWSRGPCILAGAIQATCAVEHAVIYRLLLLRGRVWRLRERTKAWMLLGDMLACMLLMMLVRCACPFDQKEKYNRMNKIKDKSSDNA